MEIKRLRHRSNNDVDASSANSEALKSTHGIPSKRPFLRAVGALSFGVMSLQGLTFAKGVDMPPQQKVHQQGNVSDLDKVRTQINDDVMKIRSARTTTEFDRASTDLFKSLSTLNGLLAKYNAPTIPAMAGDTSAEKIISLGKWLGLKAETEAPDVMLALSRKLVEVYGAAEQSKVADAVASTRQPEPVAEVAAPATVAAVVPVPRVLPAVTPTLAERLEPIIVQLADIIGNPVDKKAKKAAQGFKAKLEKAEKESAALQKKHHKNTEKDITKASKFVEQQEKAALAKQMAAYKSIGKAPDDPLIADVTELSNRPGLDPRIRQSLPRLFNMGQQAAARVMAMLRESAAEKTPEKAEQKYGAAVAIYNAEQKFFRLLLNDMIIPLCNQLEADLKSSNLPTYSELKSAEKEFNVGKTHIVFAKKSKSGRGNGKDDMVKAMEAREKYARILAQKDELPYHQVAALFNAVVSEDRLIRALIDMHGFASKKGVLDKAGSNERRKFLADYSSAAGIVADPDKDIYAEMTKQQRRSAVAIYLGGDKMSAVLDPKQMSDKQIADAEKNIRPVLMRSLETRHNDVIQTLYKSAANLVSSDPQFEQMARLRSLCAIADVNYEKFIVGKKYENGLEPIPLTAEELTTGRMGAVRSLLSNVLESAKLAADDPMVRRANAWLEATKGGVPNEKVAQTADTIYYMAKSIAAIREAELWLSTQALQPSAPDSKTVDTARENIKRAREIFNLNFSGANQNPDLWVFPGYHCNIAANVANGVTNMLAPKAFALTEAPATIASVASYYDPAGDIELRGDTPTEDERNKAAAISEARHLSMLAQLTGSQRFGVPDSDERLHDLRLSGPMRELDFEVGRDISNRALLEVPIFERHLFRRRTSMSRWTRITSSTAGSILWRTITTKTRSNTITASSTSRYSGSRFFIQTRTRRARSPG